MGEGRGRDFLPSREGVSCSRVFLRGCVYTQRRRRRRGSPEQARNAVRKRARDYKCVFELFSPSSRQRSEPGQELIAAMFFFPPLFTQTHTHTHLYIYPLCSDVAEPLRYSVCLNKQELNNKRLLTCYGCPLNYGQAKKRKTSIQLNADTEAPS